MNTYDLFNGQELVIAEKIQQRRLQILVHSCIYYELNKNVVSDKQWDEWARELKKLQEQYPNIAEQVIWNEAFKDWDASTGAFLPIKDEWVMKKAYQISGAHKKVNIVKYEPKIVKKKKRRLF